MINRFKAALGAKKSARKTRDGAAALKVEGGKLVKAKVRYGATIQRLQILGDFFLHPEESVRLIEQAVIGSPADLPEEEIAARIRGAVQTNRIELIGVTPEAMAQVVKQAMQAPADG